MNRLEKPLMSDWSNAMGATLRGGDGPFDGVFSDSRRAESGAVFVALRGPSFDGHDHVAEAAASGAVGAMVETLQPVDIPQWQVDDTRDALGRFGAAWRRAWTGRMGALTGSNGKTTVKEMIAAILTPLAPTLATRGNLNNELGVPLTLLRLRPEHRYAIIEMGANHHGEIAALTALARPTVGLVTNAGPAHLEGFGDVAGVARAKGELFSGLAEDGTAVINCDDAFAGDWRRLAGRRTVVGFGRAEDADVRLLGREALEGGEQIVVLETPWGGVEAVLPLPGEHNALNAAAAAAMALTLGASPARVIKGLSAMKAVHGRLEGQVGRAGSRIIDDSYNANPGSLKAAIDVLAAAPGRRVLVLGDMGELGGSARDWHSEAGRMARAAGIDLLFGLGGLAAEAVAAFGKGGHQCSGADELADALATELDNNTTVLVKGSRSMGLERVVAQLTTERGVH